MTGWFRTWAPALAQMTAIFVASSWSDVPPLPGGLSNYAGHFVGYALLGALALRGFARVRWNGVSFTTALRAVALSSIYGVTDEFHQSFVPGRSPTIEDWIADTLGAAAGALLAVWVARAVRARLGRVGGV